MQSKCPCFSVLAFSVTFLVIFYYPISLFVLLRVVLISHFNHEAQLIHYGGGIVFFNLI